MKNTINNILRGFVLVVLALSSLNAYAQTKISGVVKDTYGEPVIGAVVMLVGNTSVGATTDFNGQYTLTLPAQAKSQKIKVSCIGFSEQIVAIEGKKVVDFVMAEDKEFLDEAVVVGYGSMRRSDITGSISTVRIDEGDAARSASLDQLLQGNVAGLQVLNNGGAPDGGVSLRIRGLSSFNGSSEPLYVVDGIIINAESTTSESILTQGLDNQGGDDSTNGLMGINPQDIESIEILKDASATAIYGALGANGVVLITTKTAKNEKPIVRFNAGVSIAEPSKRMDILSFDEYARYLRDEVSLGVGNGAYTYLSQMYEDTNELTGLKVSPYDWQEETFQKAITQRYHFSVSGSPKNLSYAFSLGYSDQGGIIIGTGTQQYTARLNLDKTVNKRLKFGTKTNLAYVDSDMTQSTGSGRMTAASSLMRSVLSYRPYLNVAPSDDSEEDPNDDDLKANPFKWTNKDNFVNTRKEYRITPSIYGEYKILPSLVFKSTLGGDYRNSEREKFKSAFINTTPEGTNAAAVTLDSFLWNWDNTLSYGKQIRGSKINLTIGSSAYKASSTTQSVQGWNIVQFRGRVDALNSAPNSSRSYKESNSQTMSYFVRGVYNYMDRYILTATYRADGSSKFKGANKWAYFPSTAFAWRINEEPWFNVKAVSAMKLRVGWGRTGNQSIANYQTMSNYENVTIPAHDNGNEAETSIGIVPSNLANPSLKWETTEQVNLGLDLSLCKGRIAFTADAYNKVTYDLLQSKAIPTSSGFSAIYINEGTIQNKGLEFTADIVPVKTMNWEWTLDGNISFNRNKIISINEDADPDDIWITTEKSENLVYFLGNSIGSSNYCSSTANIFMEGYPMGLFYGYKIRRIVGEGETGLPLSEGGTPGRPGQIDYYDLDGNGYIDDEDRTVIGDPNPDFTYGFGSSLSFKRLTLRVNFTGVYGNEILNTGKGIESDTYNSGKNILRDAYYNAWTPENTDTKFPGLGKIRPDDLKKISDFYIEDGSYLRLSNISLSYGYPVKSTKMVVKYVNLGVSMKNAYIWTNYSGWDPDVNSFGKNVKKMGVDSGSYPSNRTLSFDLKLTF